MLKKTLSVILAVALAVTAIPFFKLQSEAANVVITIDAGHAAVQSVDDGSRTGAGANSPHNIGENEHVYTLQAALYTREYLEQYSGVTVYMTRTDANTCLSLNQRADFAYSKGSDAYVSIHYNISSNEEISGSQIYIPTANYRPSMYTNSLACANIIMGYLGSYAGMANKGIYGQNNSSGLTYPDGSLQDNLKTLRRIKLNGAPGIAMFVECGFMSNLDDMYKIMSEDYQRAYARAIADGLADYFGLSKGPDYTNNIDDTSGMTAKDNSNSNIQCVATVEKGTGFFMKGWSVNSEGVTTYQGSLDGGAWTNINSYFRKDVYDAMPNYTVCSDMNSFDTTLDTSGLSFGNHTYRIRCVSKQGSVYDVATYNIKIIPAAGSTYVNVLSNAYAPGGNFMVAAKGASDLAWVGLFGAGETPGQVNSYVYYEMQTAGVEYTFDLIKDGVLSDKRGTPAPGNYKLVLFADESSSEIVDEVPVVVVGEVQYSLDSKEPVSVTKGENVNIHGWGASKDGMKGYVYSVDGVRASEYLANSQRQDVIDHLTNSGYPTTISDTHAFADAISTANLSVGTHTISVIGITSTDVEFDIGTLTVTVEAPAVVEKLEGSVTIDRNTDSDTAYVKNIDLNTTAEQLREKFTNGGCVIKDKNGNTATGKLGTGCTVELIVDGVVHDKAVIIVKADLDGDAMATAKDVILAKMYRNAQTGGNVAKLASDFDGNGTVSAADMTSIAQAVAAN